MIKVIFFDMNGVLCIEGFRNGVTKYEKVHNIPEGAFYSIVHDFQGWKDFTLGIVLEEQYLEMCKERCKDYFFDGAQYIQFVDEMTLPNEQVIKKAKELRADGYNIGIISNSPVEWFNRSMLNLKLNQVVGICAISGILHVRKPERAIFDKALEMSGIKSDEAIYVDDRVDRVKGAYQSGMHVIGYKDYIQFDNDLKLVLKQNK